MPIFGQGMPAAMTFPLRIKALALLVPLCCGPAEAGPPFAEPKGEVILTVTGLDPARVPQGTVRFDLEGLAALGPVSFQTTSIWTEGRHDFTGIPLAKLARVLGLDADDVIVLHALNDYEVEMPLTDATEEAPILAYELDGKPMSVREKGPIWVVYPYDADPDAFQTVTAFARSVWQLDRIEVSR